MKRLLLLVLAVTLATASSAFASQFRGINRFTNRNVQKVSADMRAVGGLYVRTFKVTRESQRNGRTNEELHLAAVEEAAHRLCGFFDEGVDVSRNSNSARGVDAALDRFDMSTILDVNENVEYWNVRENLINAVDSSNAIKLYSGTAGGNNTFGTVLGIYDVRNKEILVVSHTNCGSDD